MPKSEWQSLKEKERLLRQAAAVLRAPEKDLPRIVRRFQKELEEMERKIAELREDLQT